MRNHNSTIVFFLCAVVWFLIFAFDYTYDKDFYTWTYLLASGTWWTCGIINFIKKENES